MLKQFLIIVMLGLAINCTAQLNNNILFEYNFIGTAEGLATGRVNYMDIDSNGILWVVTENALCRMDGYKVKKIQHSSTDSNSLLSNKISNFIIDKKNRIWITSFLGVTCYVINENKFYRYTNTKNITPQLQSSTVGQTVYEDEAGDIFIFFDTWINTDKNNYKYFNNAEMYKLGANMQLQKVDNKVVPFIVKGHEFTNYNCITNYRGKEYAAIANRVYELDVKTKKVIRTFDLSSDLPNGNIYEIEVNIDDGHLELITFLQAPLSLNVNTGKVEKKIEEKLKSKVSINGTVPFYYLGKIYYAGTSRNTAFYVFDSTRNWFLPQFQLNPEKSDQYYGSYVFAMSNKLYTSYNKGIYEINLKKPLLQKFLVTDSSQNIINNNLIINHFTFNNNHYCVMANNGLKILDSNFNAIATHKAIIGKANNINNATSGINQVLKINNEAYFATDSGIVKWQLVNNKVSIYNPTLQDHRIRDFIKISDSTFLCAGANNTVFTFNYKQGVFTDYKNLQSLFINGQQNIAIFKTAAMYKNKVYITTNTHGIVSYNVVTKKLESEFIKGHSNTFTSNIFLLQKNRNIFLLSTNKGIYTIDLDNNKVISTENINNKLGLCYSMAWDADSNLWVSSINGIWCKNKQYEQWIYEGNEFEIVYNSALPRFTRDDFNNLYIGISGKLVKLNHSVLKEKVVGNTIITEVNSMKQSVNFALVNNIKKEIILEVNDTKLDIDFSLYCKNYSPNASYWYLLEPLNTVKQIQNNGHISLTGLPHGSYTLTVGGTDRYGNPFPNTDTLYITIKPKWYQTILFKLLALLLIGYLIYLFVNSRIKLINDKSELKLKLDKMEMSALRAQMNPHFIFNTLNSINSYIVSNKTIDASNYITKFSKLIRNILDNSKNEFITIEKEMETIQLYLLMENIRFENKFEYKINVAEDCNEIQIPPMIIQPYIENAIWHGLLPKKIPGCLYIDIIKNSNTIEITIEDDGVGRKNLNIPASEHYIQKSYGTQITQERILNSNPNNTIEILDLVDANNNACGTKVILKLITN